MSDVLHNRMVAEVVAVDQVVIVVEVVTVVDVIVVVGSSSLARSGCDTPTTTTTMTSATVMDPTRRWRRRWPRPGRDPPRSRQREKQGAVAGCPQRQQLLQLRHQRSRLRRQSPPLSQMRPLLITTIVSDTVSAPDPAAAPAAVPRPAHLAEPRISYSAPCWVVPRTPLDNAELRRFHQ